MNTNNILNSVIESGTRRAIFQFEEQNSGDMLSDVYLKIDKDNNTLLFFDDMENQLSKETIEIWEDEQGDPDYYIKSFIHGAKPIFQELNKDHLFDKEYISKPFSVNLVDDNFILIEELFFLDDDTLKLNGESLLDLDKELNDFFNNLLKDFE